jgi:cytochrome c oxidase assembly protein subunit 15
MDASPNRLRRNSRAPARLLVARRHRRLLLAGAILTGLLVALGGIVCATESGAACPDWPGCYGRVVPPPQINAIIEYSHRLVAGLTSPVLIAAAVVVRLRYRPFHWVSRPPIVALPFLLAVIIFGAVAVLRGLPRPLAVLDLGSALLVLALITVAATVAYATPDNPGRPVRLSGSPVAWLGLASLASVYLVHLGGIVVAGPGSLSRCLGWPLWRLVPGDVPGSAQPLRLLLSALGILLIAGTVFAARRMPRAHPALPRVALAVGLLLAGELVVGLLLSTAGPTVGLVVLNAVLAAALWVGLVALVTLAGIQVWD